MNRKTTEVAATLLGLALVAALPSTATAVQQESSTATVNPSTTGVAAGGDLALSGAVKPADVRTVELQRLLGDTWVDFQKVTTDDQGRYAANVPTTMFVGTAKYRAVAQEDGQYAEARSDAVTVAIRPQGKSAAHTYLLSPLDTQPYRWDPCAPVQVRVNPAGAPAGYLKDIHGAIDRINAQSGLRLRYAGETGIVPRSRQESYPDGTDLVVAFVYPGQTDYFPKGSGAAGFGGARGSYKYDAQGHHTAPKLSTGFVVLKRSLYKELDAGFTAGKKYGWNGTRGQLLMHEIGHAVGMGHANLDKAEIMYPAMQDHAAVWGAGDAANLGALGIASGCVDQTQLLAARTAVRRVVTSTHSVAGVLD